ncbi:hypothetical protein DPX16_12135 [Anabarilius grahami]|uniref:Uncharacterized protein n=1 Tax=Anabarilius grahami TaxID=495550 RepID=A0A3N0YQN6_ANAGA|nr:hypothetical protein DPX16_12135 [Anabarilius grahami]
MPSSTSAMFTLAPFFPSTPPLLALPSNSDLPWASCSPALPRYVVPLATLQASEPWTPPRPVDPLIPRSLCSTFIPQALLGSLVPPATPWSVITLVLPRTSGPLATPRPSTSLAPTGSSFPPVPPLSLLPQAPTQSAESPSPPPPLPSSTAVLHWVFGTSAPPGSLPLSSPPQSWLHHGSSLLQFQRLCWGSLPCFFRCHPPPGSFCCQLLPGTSHHHLFHGSSLNLGGPIFQFCVLLLCPLPPSSVGLLF